MPDRQDDNDMVSPYLLRRCRTYEEFLRDRAARLARLKKARKTVSDTHEIVDQPGEPAFTPETTAR